MIDQRGQSVWLCEGIQKVEGHLRATGIPVLIIYKQEGIGELAEFLCGQQFICGLGEDTRRY